MSKEKTFTDEEQARTARREHINTGRPVSLLAYDPARDLYIFDILD